MLTDLFLLIVLNKSTGEIVEGNDMYFYSVSRCIWFANEINMSIYPTQREVNAYCVPRLEDPEKVKVYNGKNP